MCIPCALLFTPVGQEPVYENLEQAIDESSTSVENTMLISYKSCKERTIPRFLPRENAMIRSEPVYSTAPLYASEGAGYLNVTDCFYPVYFKTEISC